MRASGDDLSSLTTLHNLESNTDRDGAHQKCLKSWNKDKVLKGKRMLVASAYDRVKLRYTRMSVLFNDSKGRLNL